MDRDKKLKLFSDFKKHRIKIIAFALVLLFSASLIIAAMNMLQFPSGRPGEDNQDKPEKNSKTTQNKSKSQKDKEDASNPFEKKDETKTQETPFDQKDNGPSASRDKEQDIQGRIQEELNQVLPDISIDLNRQNSSEEEPSIESGDSLSVYSGEKPIHRPLFEVYGKTYTPFMKIMSMEGYYDNRWIPSGDTQSTLYSWERPSGLTAIHVQPLEAVKGFMPIIGNAVTAYFPGAQVSKFPEVGASYSQTDITNYEMFYKDPLPSREKLKEYHVEYYKEYVVENHDKLTAFAEKIVPLGMSTSFTIYTIEKYLKENYTYDSEANKQNPLGSDSLDRFLFETHRGTQLEFITAFVQLMRCLQLPTHIATGYKVDPNLQYQVIYEDQLAVYPEVKFADLGWVPLDIFNDFAFYKPETKTETTIDFMSDLIKKGQEFHVLGSVKDADGNPVDDLYVLIYLKKKKDEDCLSLFKGKVSDGRFDLTSNFSEETEVGLYQVVAHTLESDVYAESWSDPPLKIMAETRMEFSAPTSVRDENAFSVHGFIKEKCADQPIKKGEVEIISNQNIQFVAKKEASLDDTGRFEGRYELQVGKNGVAQWNLFFLKKYSTDYTLHYKGTDFYLPCQLSGNVSLWHVQWDRVVLALSFILMVILLLFFWVWRRNRLKTKEKAMLESMTESGVKDTVVVSDVSLEKEKRQNADLIKKRYIDISFPGIPHGFPDVWEVHIPLKICFTDELGDSEGAEQAFHDKGTFRLTVFSVMEHCLMGQKSLRLVDYREEIIDLGKSFFEKLRRKENLLSTMLTPREMLEEMSRQLNKEEYQCFEKIIFIFEKATYSSRIINRGIYEDFYRLLMQMEKGGEGV